MRIWSIVPLLVAPAAAQGIWIQANPVTHPSSRVWPAMAYDAATGHVWLFSGDANTSGTVPPTPELWRWDGIDWQMTQWGGVQARGIACFCADGVGGLLLFGGRVGSGGSTSFLGDTHRLVQGQWTSVPGAGPPARAYAAMVSTSQGALLFGGVGGTPPGSAVLDDTWLWNGAWTQLSPAQRPSPRYLHALAFDSARNVAVLFGGSVQGSTQPLADTWEWNGVTWAQRFPAHVPTRREAHSLHYLPARQRTLLLGGTTFTSAGTPVSEIWMWDGVDWTMTAGAGAAPERTRAGTAYDAARQVVVVFGGQGASWPVLDDTLEYADVPASFTQFGAGCVGPNGLVPTLAGVAAEPPRLGSAARFRLTSLPPTLTVPLFVLGTSDTVDPGPPPYALPFDLAPLGWPGCRQLVSNEAATLAATVSGQADHTIAVPATFGLLGFTFYAQAIVFYVPTGVAVSNAVRAIVGT